MSAIREALEAAGIPFERPKPSETWECLKQKPIGCGGANRRFTDTHQWCPRCEQWLEFDWFYRNRARASGRLNYCKPCWDRIIRERAARKRAA